MTQEPRSRLALLDAGELNLHPPSAGGSTASCLEQQIWLLSVGHSVLAPCINHSVLEAVAQLAQVVLLCTKLVTGSALMAMLTWLCVQNLCHKSFRASASLFNAQFYSLSNISFESCPSAKAVWKHLSIVLELRG